MQGPKSSTKSLVLSPKSSTTSSIAAGGLRFAPSKPAKAEKAPRPPRVKAKNDPRLVAAARELRDRWLEQVNAGLYLPTGNAKYDVGRLISEARETPAPPTAPLLVA